MGKMLFGILPVIAFAVVMPSDTPGQTAIVQGEWVSAWSTAVQEYRSVPSAPAIESFDNQTIRMVIRPTISGHRLRVRFSNELSSSPLSIGSAHVALLKADGVIVPESDRALSFAGATSVDVPGGAPILSDPIDIDISAFGELAISVYLPKATKPTTYHAVGQHDTYISGPGDFTKAERFEDSLTTRSWYFLSGLELWETVGTAAIVTFGDSITDGFGAKAQYGDWPNQLAERLASEKGAIPLGVSNEGIGGNRILHDGLGVAALSRFDRDVLSQPGVVDLIVLEGINDIGWPNMKPRRLADGTTRPNRWAEERVSADDLIRGFKQLIDRAHEHGIRVFGGTMTPYGGNANTFTDEGEAVRQAVNKWIRTSGAFDGVFDFDAAVRDPDHPERFRDDLQTGDYLHPNASGYKAMASVIDLSLLRRGIGSKVEDAKSKVTSGK